MRRLLEGVGAVLGSGGLIGVLDATLLCLGFGFTVGSAIPALRTLVEGRAGRP